MAALDRSRPGGIRCLRGEEDVVCICTSGVLASALLNMGMGRKKDVALAGTSESLGSAHLDTPDGDALASSPFMALTIQSRCCWPS